MARRESTSNTCIAFAGVERKMKITGTIREKAFGFMELQNHKYE